MHKIDLEAELHRSLPTTNVNESIPSKRVLWMSLDASPPRHSGHDDVVVVRTQSPVVQKNLSPTRPQVGGLMSLKKSEEDDDVEDATSSSNA